MAPYGPDQLRMAEEFWLREDAQLAVRTRNVAAVFRLLHKFGISQSQIGNAVGLEQGVISRVMNGRRDIVALDLLERIAHGIGMPDHCRILFGLAPQNLTTLRTIATRGDPTVPAAGMSLLEHVESLRQGVNDSVSRSAIAESGLDDWEQTVLRYGEATRHRAPGALLIDLTNDFAELKRVLALRQSSSALRRLTSVTAQMAGLMSLTLIKLDLRSAAHNWARTARLAADETGDPDVQSWVRAQEAYAHFYSGDFVDAARIARQAQAVAWRGSSIGAALAAALEARAFSILGAADDARDALVRAERALAILEEDHRSPSAFGYNEAQFRFHEGNALTNLHDTRGAWVAQDRALELYPGNDYLDRALIHLDRASCLIHDGDFNSACTIATETVTGLSREQSAGLITVRARELLLALPSRQSSHARELKEILATAHQPE